jgi:hypothetical protein
MGLWVNLIQRAEPHRERQRHPVRASRFAKLGVFRQRKATEPFFVAVVAERQYPRRGEGRYK